MSADVRLAQVEDGLDDGLGAGLPDQPILGPLAHEQSQRASEQGLAGAGLAGQHVEARLEFEHRVLDEHEVADAERDQHDSRS